MTSEVERRALERLRAWAASMPGPGADLRRDPIEDLLTVINARVTKHVHRVAHDQARSVWRTGLAIPASEGHWEERQSLPGPEAPDEAPEPTESRRRPGKTPPTAMQALEATQQALVNAGMAGYAPLSVADGVETLARVLQMTRETLAVAQASTRQHLEASSHRAQIAEHYRAALQRIAEGGVVGMRQEAQAALAAPEWDKRIRP